MNRLKIVLWGTGGFAERFMADYTKFIHKIAELICVVDDCDARTGSFFFGFRVCSVKDLNVLEFDHCIVCEFYHDMTFDTAVKEFPPQVSEKFLRGNDYYGILVDRSGFLRNKSILFIGDRSGYEYDSYSALLTMDSYEYAEDVKSAGDISRYDHIFICPTWYTSDREAEEYERKVISGIKEDLRDRVIPYLIWREFMTRNTRFIGKGEANPDKKFMVIMGCKGRGWAALLLHFYSFVRFAKNHGMIPVIDMKNFRTQYIKEEDLGKEDVWLRYFLPVSDYTLEEVYNSKNVYLCPREYLLHIKLSRSDINLNETTRDFLEDKAKMILGDSDKKTLGVLFRGTDFYTAFGHDKPFEIDHYFKKIDNFFEEHGDYDRLFLATEVEEVVQKFRERYGNKVCFTDQDRFSEDERRILSSIGKNRDLKKESLDYLTVLYLLIKCDSIMGIRCGGTLLATGIKKDYEHIDIFKNKTEKTEFSLRRYTRYIERKLGIMEFSPRYKLKLKDY